MTGRGFRVRHYEEGAVRHFGRLEGVAAHHATLEPFVSRLLREGAGGVVVLVDEATGRAVARRRVRPFGAGGRARFRAPAPGAGAGD